MQQWRALRCFVSGIALVCVVLLSACSSTPPEQAVRVQLTALQAAIDARDAGALEGVIRPVAQAMAAIDARDAGALEDLLDDEFIGNDGMNRRAVRQLAGGIFLRYRDVSAKLGPVNVELRGNDEAIARFSVLATAGSGGLLPDDGQVFNVETGWRRSGRTWKLVNAGWKAKL
ncbi:MAG: hypothetical protein KGL91_05315 [Xanthomonadaceae bacterium]|nr:hypothetical protein [Xanthomonadaceae bacterium]